MKWCLFFAVTILFISACSERDPNQTSDAPETIEELSDSITPLISDSIELPEENKATNYCYDFDDGEIIEYIDVYIKGDSVFGNGDGELISDAMHWSFDVSGIMLDNERADLDVIFHNEGGDESVKEEWLIYKDSLRILGDERGTKGPYFFLSCN